MTMRYMTLLFTYLVTSLLGLDSTKAYACAELNSVPQHVTSADFPKEVEVVFVQPQLPVQVYFCSLYSCDFAYRLASFGLSASCV